MDTPKLTFKPQAKIEIQDDKKNPENIIPEKVKQTETIDTEKLQENVIISNMKNPNVPNVNIPERIIFCIDVCYADQKTMFKLVDGTTITPLNMIKRILEYFIHLKPSVNRRVEFAILILKDNSAYWFLNFTNNIKEIINKLDLIKAESCTSETYDFNKVFEVIKEKVQIPQYKEDLSIIPPPFVVRMIVLYGRANCIPLIPTEDSYFTLLKKHLYFYIDIILSHEEDCTLNKCEEIYDSLQHLDNGYSYVYEVSRNATKIHTYIAKLLAHPLQRPLQRNAEYIFGSEKN